MLDRELTGAQERRDIRCWTARRASAEIVEPAGGAVVRFGMSVTLERGDGRRQTFRQAFRIAGEDEADAARGRIGYVAPLARAVLGRRIGDEVEFAGGTPLVVAFA